jgi:hypothetical protein
LDLYPDEIKGDDSNNDDIEKSTVKETDSFLESLTAFFEDILRISKNSRSCLETIYKIGSTCYEGADCFISCTWRKRNKERDNSYGIRKHSVFYSCSLVFDIIPIVLGFISFSILRGAGFTGQDCSITREQGKIQDSCHPEYYLSQDNYCILAYTMLVLIEAISKCFLLFCKRDSGTIFDSRIEVHFFLWFSRILIFSCIAVVYLSIDSDKVYGILACTTSSTSSEGDNLFYSYSEKCFDQVTDGREGSLTACASSGPVGRSLDRSFYDNQCVFFHGTVYMDHILNMTAALAVVRVLLYIFICNVGFQWIALVGGSILC